MADPAIPFPREIDLLLDRAMRRATEAGEPLGPLFDMIVQLMDGRALLEMPAAGRA